MTNTTSAQSRHTKYKRMIWMACIWSWPACLFGVMIPFALIGGFIPPPMPSSSAQEIAAFFTADPTHVRIGAIGFLYFSALSLLFYAVVSEEIKKIEGQPALLARVQFGSAVILVTIFQLLGLAWLLCTYRTDTSPDVIRMLNDYCWFCWSMFVPTYMFQYICNGIIGFWIPVIVFAAGNCMTTWLLLRRYKIEEKAALIPSASLLQS